MVDYSPRHALKSIIHRVILIKIWICGGWSARRG